MLKNEATKERPFLNNIDTYIPDKPRTREDNEVIVWDVLGMQRQRRSHCGNERMEQIYNQVMNYFMTNEWHLYQAIQTGLARHEDYERDVNDYLIRTFPEMRVDTDRAIIMDRVKVATYQYSVLQPLIDNPETSDIKVCGPNDIRVRIHGKAYKSNATFYDAQELYRFITGIAMRNHLALDKPMITFTDTGDAHYILRFVISAPMINAIDYPYMHIRKVPKNKPDFDKLIKDEMLPPIVKDYLIDRAKYSRGVVFAGPPGCVDAETEFFNGSQWKKISEYNKDEKVLQFNPATNEATLVKPIQYIKTPCKTMYHFETKYGINQTLSMEHNVLYYNKTHVNGKKAWSDKVQEMSAKDLCILQNDGKFNGGFKTDFIYSGQGLNLTDIEIKIMLAVICDGTFKKDCKTNWCSIRVKKQRKKDELRKILNEWGKEYVEKDYSNGYTRFSFNAPRKEKVFTPDWYSCTNEQLQIICDNVLKWDGYTKGRIKTFSTKEKNSADFIQFAFSSCGYRVTISVDDRRNQEYITNGKKYKRTNLYYHLTISNNTIVGMAWHNDGRTNNTVIKEVSAIDGYKYCFVTPTHALVLRRKENIFITSNSGKTTALNAFIEYIPKTRETLVIQENDELFTNQSGFMFKHVTHGFQNEPIVTLEDLAKMALVEGCNEFVVGEVKGGEMRYVMTLLNAGGYAALTVHSTNAYETMDKLADLVKYGSDYSFDEARRMLKTFDTVVYMENYQIQEILEVDGYNDETHQFNYINIYKNPTPRGM